MKKITFLILCCCLFTVGQIRAQVTKTVVFENPGDATWTVPHGVLQVTIEAWGAGGGGGYTTNNNSYAGGGGGGAYAKSTVNVLYGQVLTVHVGEGGYQDTDGDYSSVQRFTTTLAQAAGGKSAKGSTQGAAGGAVADCIGDTKYAGGNGGNGDSQKFIFSAFYAGAGGGAAGANGPGNNGKSANGWWQTTSGGDGNGPYSGKGGDGGKSGTTVPNTNPTGGNNYGGGGGGSVNNNTSDASGAPGYVIITYVENPCAATAGSIALGAWTCTSTDTTVILENVTIPIQGGGTFSWQKQDPTWTDIVGANWISLTPATSGVYRRGYTIDGCPTVYTDPITVTTPKSSDMGHIVYNGSTSNTTARFCKNTAASATLTTSLTGVTDSEILWEMSFNGDNWFGNTLGVTYDFSVVALSEKTYIRYSKIISPTCTIPCNNVFVAEPYTLPVVNSFTDPTDLCPGATSYNVVANITPGSSPIITDYYWTDATGNSPTGTITATLPNCGTSYHYSLQVKDANGCYSNTKNGSFTTTSPVLLFNPIPSQMAAKGANDCEYVIPDLTELLKTSVQSTSCGNAITTVTATPAIGSVITTTTDVMYTVSDMCGGSVVNVPITINIPTTPTVTLAASPARICHGGQSTLTATATGTKVTYQWSNNVEDGGPDNVKLTIAATGQSSLVETSTVYSVTATDAYGCVTTAQTTVYTNPIVDGDNNDKEYEFCSTSSTTYAPTAPAAPAVTTYSWSVAAPSTITGAINGTDQNQVNTGSLKNSGLLKESVIYTVTPTTTLGGVSCEGETFTVTANVLPQINTIGAITDFDDADVIITLWYGACDTLYNVIAPTFTNNIASQDVTATLTNNKAAYNNGTLLGRIAPGEYTITWKITDPCGYSVTYTKKYIVRYPNCGESDPNYSTAYRVTDVDGNVYNTVRIGCECWIASNLRTNVTNSHVYTSDEYTDAEENEENYGRLYSWYTAAGVAENSVNALPTITEDTYSHYKYVNGVCPEGWALPTKADLTNMLNIATGVPAIKSNDPSTWLPGANGTNLSGFNAKGAGYYDNTAERYVNLLGETYFWTCENSESTVTKGACCVLTHSCPEMLINDKSKSLGYSVRCLRRMNP